MSEKTTNILPKKGGAGVLIDIIHEGHVTKRFESNIKPCTTQYA